MIRSMKVYGIPQSKGSTKSFRAGNRIVTTSTNKNLKDWSMLVADVAQRQAGKAPLIDEPIEVDVTFYMPRPKSAPKSREYPLTKPDIDKLLRAVLDPLTGVWFTDDARIVDVTARKRYGDPPHIALTVIPFSERKVA